MATTTAVSKSYTTGELIITSHPLVHALNSDYKGSHCDYCTDHLTISASVKCSLCNHMYYCDRKCYENDAKYHKLECSIYNKYYGCDFNNRLRMWLMVDDDTLFRVLLRLLLLIKSDPSTATKSVKCHNGVSRCLNDLVSHANDIRNDTIRYKIFEQFYEKFQTLGIDVSKERVLRHFGQIAVNGYEYKSYDVRNISHYSNKFLGFGLFIPISIFDHSCQPNAAYVNTSNTIQIRAMRPIAANEEIFIDYIPLERSTPERLEILKTDWYFDCTCSKCHSISDISVNYNLLKSLKFIDSAGIERSGSTQWSVMKQIYKGYHPAYSFYLLAYLMVMLRDSKGAAKDVVRVKMLALENIKVTHGCEHAIYKFCKNLFMKQY